MEATRRCAHTERRHHPREVEEPTMVYGQCERNALPDMVCCAWHTGPEVITVKMWALHERLKKTQEK